MEGIIKKERIIVHNKEEEGRRRKEESASLRIWGTTIHFISYRISFYDFCDMVLVGSRGRKPNRLHDISNIVIYDNLSETEINYHSYTDGYYNSKKGIKYIHLINCIIP